MRRKPGALIPLEVEILTVAMQRASREHPEFHGFALAAELQHQAGAKRLTAHGTLYKALSRLETAGFLESRWEDPIVALQAGRPRRRLYQLTAAGEAALVTATQPQRHPTAAAQRRPAPGTAS